MGDKTGIQWTEATWNPLAGCTPVSEGCRNCYAATMALRLEAMGQSKYVGTAKRTADGRAVFTGKIVLADERTLDQPLRWTRPRKIFVNSMSDLFHATVDDYTIHRIYSVMEQTPQHTYQVLTKRPERMAAFTLWRYRDRPMPDHIWHGTSVESQDTAQRTNELRKVPASVRFISAEPLLGLVALNLTGISWLIVGGESGPNARPMALAWARSLRDQAVAAGTAFFFKQHGEYTPYYEAVDTEAHKLVMREYPNGGMKRVGKHAAGRLLDGKEWSEFPS